MEEWADSQAARNPHKDAALLSLTLNSGRSMNNVCCFGDSSCKYQCLLGRTSITRPRVLRCARTGSPDPWAKGTDLLGERKVQSSWLIQIPKPSPEGLRPFLLKPRV